MKTFVKHSLAAMAFAAAAASAQAAMVDSRDVVTDKHGEVLVNTFGNCVRTKWEAGADKCAAIGNEARTVYFDFDKSELTPAAKAKLDSLVDAISMSDTVESVSIVGYADRIGTSSYNYGLSQRRARSVENYLAARGVSTRNTDVRSFGEEMSVSNCEGMEGNQLRACLWRDRRVEIEINFAQ
ncbi:MAG: hypothetical protein CMM93_00695 [Rickettsiales bacterium]|nr:hypothetical protein [Rickettsiales bacterium]|tara:strand:+ start:244 stop:792 length:549 start_codon:yes stop_codon:yes gene_type:complete